MKLTKKQLSILIHAANRQLIELEQLIAFNRREAAYPSHAPTTQLLYQDTVTAFETDAFNLRSARLLLEEQELTNA